MCVTGVSSAVMLLARLLNLHQHNFQVEGRSCFVLVANPGQTVTEVQRTDCMMKVWMISSSMRQKAHEARPLRGFFLSGVK